MKPIFNRKIGVIEASALGAVVLVMALASCAPQPAPTVTEPLPTATLVAAPATTATPLRTPDSPEDWLVFCDSEAGCTFSYPADADFKAGKSRFGIYTIRLQF